MKYEKPGVKPWLRGVLWQWLCKTRGALTSCLSLNGLIDIYHDGAEPAGAQPTLCLRKTHQNPSVYSQPLQTPRAREDPRNFSPSPKRYEIKALDEVLERLLLKHNEQDPRASSHNWRAICTLFMVFSFKDQEINRFSVSQGLILTWQKCLLVPPPLRAIPFPSGCLSTTSQLISVLITES